jgi:predicted MFS family arabinose efflux permease
MDGDPGGWRQGLGVLEQRGVAAWLHAWHALPAPPPARPGTPRSRPPAGTGDQLVAALATMAAACLAGGG